MFDDFIVDIDAAVQDAFSVKGVLNDTYTVDVVIDQDVMRYNDYGESIRNSYEITFFNEQATGLATGATVDIYNSSLGRDGRYTLTNPVQGDSNITIWAANVIR